MSEVQSRTSAPRGRGSHRAGRGGYSSRGGGRSSARQANGDAHSANSTVPLEDQGELGLLKKQYSNEIPTLKELFPDWTDEDLVFALQETDGDLQSTIERISEGTVSRFADVKKKTREKSRTKSTAGATAETEKPTVSTRGRGRGVTEGRGGRTRGSSERGARHSRGGRVGASANTSRSQATTTTPAVANDAGAWGDTPSTDWAETAQKTETTGNWDQPTAANTERTTDTWADSKPTETGDVQKSSIIPQGTTKSWASMLAKPKPSATGQIAPPHAKETLPLSNTIEPTLEGDIARETPPGVQVADQHTTGKDSRATSGKFGASTDSGLNLTPSKDPLTEDNVEQLPDASGMTTTETVASTRDASSTIGSLTPAQARSQQASMQRPPMGGYQTSAWKATGMPGRSASFQRKMIEQQEAVVMPENHAVDRAAVQFGSMGISGEQDGRAFDVDEDREEAETRAQPPQQSPSAPRASLPQMSMPQTAPQEILPQENNPTPKQAPGLPNPSQNAQSLSQQPPTGPSDGVQGQSHPYGRYGAGGFGQEQNVHSQKPYDPFNQQTNYPTNQQDQPNAYPSHSHQSSQNPNTARSHLGGFSHDQNEYNPQYQDQGRNAYQQYHAAPYNQQNNSSLPENVPPARSGSGFGPSENTYGSGLSGTNQSRFSEAQNSGHNTPNPTAGAQHHAGSQSHHMHHQQAGPGGYGNYNYGNPYNYSGYNQYMNQYPGQYYNQQGYGGHYGKNSLYGQSHSNYNMPTTMNMPYEHSSSPANAGGYNSSSIQNRESSYGAGIGSEFSRTGSAQATSQGQQTHSSATGSFAGMTEGFGRSTSGNYGAHNQQQYGQQTSSAQEDSLKALHESKSGPSPSLSQPGRPGSTINTANQPSNQPGYGAQQQGYGAGGYPNHLNQLHNNQGSQYSGLGGLGSGHQSGAQSHQGGGYGNYGGFGNNYQNYGGGRGGWGGNNYAGH